MDPTTTLLCSFEVQAASRPVRRNLPSLKAWISEGGRDDPPLFLYGIVR